jgi:hypothetical protein
LRSSFPRSIGRSGAALAALAMLALAALPAAAGVNGAWQTHIRVRDFSDLLVTDDAVWCATGEAGLLRFDRAARTFTSIVKEPGALASNQLTCLTYDRIGRLWVGTRGAGVSRLDADGASWELVNAFDGLPVDSVTTMIQTGDTLWIGTRRGIALWDGRQVLGSLPDGNTLSFDTTYAVPAITGIAVLNDTLWLASQRGVGFARISTNLTDWRPANDGLPNLEIDGMVSDGRELVLQTIGGLHRWVPDSAKWLPTDPVSVAHRIAVEHGDIYATSSVGVFRYAGFGVWTLFNDGSPAGGPGVPDDPEPGAGPASAPGHYAGLRNETTQIAALWERVETAPGDTGWVEHVPPGPIGNGYSNIVIENSRVYAATRLEGISRWDGASWDMHWPPVPCPVCPYTFRNPIQVFAMLADGTGNRPDGDVWVSCWGVGVERLNDTPSPNTVTHYWDDPGDPNFESGLHSFGFGAAVDSTGGRWFGMDSPDLLAAPPLGLDSYDANGNWVDSYGPGSPPGSLIRGGKIRAITVDLANRVWVGYAGSANSGVDHFNAGVPPVGPNTPALDFGTVQGTSQLDIWGLVAQGDNIWALTDRDLKRINRVGSRRIIQSLGTPAGRPLGMRLVDASADGSVWVGTEEGLRRWRPPYGAQDFTDFTAANSPLVANDVRALAVDRATGAVWIGTAEGLNRFDPLYQPPALPEGMPDTLTVYPSPATITGLGVQLRLQGASSSYTGAIYDVTGRRVHAFRLTSTTQVMWDGRDEDGTPVKPGVFFVRAEGGGRQARARFVLLR